MIEEVHVVFGLNQDEYEAAVPTNNEHMRIGHSLPDNKEIVVEVVLGEKYGVKMVKTYDAKEAKTKFKEIWKAKKLENKFTPGLPGYTSYELKLKSGKLVPAELRVESWGTLYWEQPYTKERFKKEDVAGWRVEKTHYPSSS